MKSGKGFALITTLIVLSILLIFCFTLFQLASFQQAKHQFDWKFQRAKYIAEAGITKAQILMADWASQGKFSEALVERGYVFEEPFSDGKYNVAIEYVHYSQRVDGQPWRIKATGLFQGRKALETSFVDGYDPLRKIVVFAKGSPSSMWDEIASKHGEVIKDLPLIRGTVLVLNSSGEKSKLIMETGVERIDNDQLVKIPVENVGKRVETQGGTTQPAQVTPWGIGRISAPQAWGTSTAIGVKIAVIDTGISTGHPDLKVAGGANIITPKKSYNDDNGHGSHVAGIIAALSNSVGVVGAGYNANLYAVKVLNANGSGYLSDVIGGIQWSVNNSIRLANMSLGSSTNSQSLKDAVTAAGQAGLIMVAAAGNDSGGPVIYPAAYPEVIAVTALTSSDTFASFSNKGPEVDVIAPGVSIFSTYKGTDYATLSGTSMAAPHVTAACGLKLALSSSLTPSQMLDALRASSDLVTGLSTEQQGAGVVNAYKLVTAP